MTTNSMVNTNRELTAYLKGIAILLVIGGHFSHRFLPFPLPFFGNHFIAFFFILSGFGLYYSNKKLSEKTEGVFSFYFKRFLRIYPLYWVNFFLDLAFDNRVSYTTGEFIQNFFLLHFTNPPHVWFLHALIPCYVFAPLVYRFVTYFKHISAIILIVSLVVVDIISHAIGLPDVRCWIYREIYFSHYFLFCSGMYLAYIGDKIQPNNKALLITFLIMMASFYCTSGYPILPDPPMNNTILTTYTFIFSTLAFAALFIKSYHIYLPLKGILCLVGTYTYSLYLFHGIFPSVLERVGILRGESIVNLIIFILAFPFFLVGCIFAEQLFSNKFNMKKAYSNTINSIRPRP